LVKKKKSGVTPGYLHGYSPEEQARLVKQARFLEPTVFENVNFSKQQKLLEVGCGVGAQTEILLRRFPHLKIHGIDSSKPQITRARARLAPLVKSGRVSFEVGDALSLPYSDNTFDSAFLCWFLEHVGSPVEILRETRRVMKPSAKIYCSEVLNSSFYVHPYSPATLQYWFSFNDHQWTMKGDPFMGAKLANYLLAAGFQNVRTEIKTHFYDNRAPKQRAEFIGYWTELLLSGAPSLIKAKLVTPKTVEAMTEELSRLKNDPDAVFYYSWVQAHAEAY